MAEKHPWLRRVGIATATVALATACSSGGSDDDSRRSVTFPTPTTQPGDINFATPEAICLLETVAGAESISTLIKEGRSRIALGVDYYRYGRNPQGELGTEKLSDPWIADCMLNDGTAAKFLLTIKPLSRDGDLNRQTGLAIVSFGPNGETILVDRNPETIRGEVVYKAQTTPLKLNSSGVNSPVEIVGNETDPSSLFYAVTLEDGTKKRIMTREFFPGETPEQVMQRS